MPRPRPASHCRSGRPPGPDGEPMKPFVRTFALALAAALATWPVPASALELLNVSYDPTRELYRSVNEAFAEQYKAKTGTDVTIRLSHGGSGTQARAIVDGLEADVATLAMWPDTNAIAKAGLMPLGWEKNLPNDSLP